jgi:hypothetical protein
MEKNSLARRGEGFWLRTWRFLCRLDETMSVSSVASVEQVAVLDGRVKRLEEQVSELSRGGTRSARDQSAVIR